MNVNVDYNEMEGYESRINRREAKTYTIGKLKYQAYNVMQNGELIKDKFIAQMNYNGKMLQGGMKRGVDSINNWPSTAVKHLIDKGFDFDTHGNCYLKGNKIVSKSDYMDVETKFLKAMAGLVSKL
jgi:hypothetical protein